jgi:dipeptidase D
MNTDIKLLEPKLLWNNFANLNAVPRASKKEEQVRKFIKNFGLKLNLETFEDAIGNVIIKKPATKGMEGREPVMIQSHLDMVHQKNNETIFDFDSQGIEMMVEGDWVRAKGTTLGADNGIGVASIMALLEAENLPHPAIEALFTIDEETGMTGALNLKGGHFSARFMLNLDTEDDRELTIGCAGGIDITAKSVYKLQHTTDAFVGFSLSVKGLTGGHSGMDIHKDRANANILMNSLLLKVSEKLNIKISAIDGGSLRNAIPRESTSEFMIPDEQVNDLKFIIDAAANSFKEKYALTDPNLNIQLESKEVGDKHVGDKFQSVILKAIDNCPNGVYKMSPEIKGLVQTSNNLARVLLKEGELTILCLTRSALDEEKMELAEKIKSILVTCDAEVNFSGSYPGWAPKPDSSIVQLMRNVYKELFKEEPLVNACHAGLECGIIGSNYPNMEGVSFGPNITGAHSPDEKVQISSVQKYWTLLLETLQRMPEKTN